MLHPRTLHPMTLRLSFATAYTEQDKKNQKKSLARKHFFSNQLRSNFVGSTIPKRFLTVAATDIRMRSNNATQFTSRFGNKGRKNIPKCCKTPF